MPAGGAAGQAGAAVSGQGGAGTADRWPIECRACRRVLAYRLADGRLVPATAAVTVDGRRIVLSCDCGRVVRVRRG